MNRIYLILISLLMGMTGCTEKPTQADQIRGAWQVVKMQLITADRDTINVPVNESLVIFGNGYYSIAYAFGDKRFSTYTERWHPSDSEKIARYSSLIVNTGSYRINGSYIYAKPFFALAPEFIEGQAVFSYKFAEQTLELTWEKSIAFDGLEYPSGGAVTFLQLTRAK